MKLALTGSCEACSAGEIQTIEVTLEELQKGSANLSFDCNNCDTTVDVGIRLMDDDEVLPTEADEDEDYKLGLDGDEDDE